MSAIISGVAAAPLPSPSDGSVSLWCPHSFDNWHGISSLHGLDNFYGVGNFDGTNRASFRKPKSLRSSTRSWSFSS
ncbi:hypothetical protein BDZ89DRAFT_1165809 [Hymenopellis radicata]|nr:hypothetical protein BDZ89DRAFT_1165809 [Hymenopellis radicata]